MIYDNMYMNKVRDAVDAFNKTGDDIHLARIIRDYGIDGVLMIKDADIATAYLIQRPDMFNDERIPEHLRERVLSTHLKLISTDLRKNIKSTLKYLEYLLVGETFKHGDVEFIKDVARVVRNTDDENCSYSLKIDINRQLLDILSRKYPDMIQSFIRDIPSNKFDMYSDGINAVITNLIMGASSGDINVILYYILDIISACYYAIVIGDGDDVSDLGYDEEIIISEEQWGSCYSVVYEAISTLLDTSDAVVVRLLMELTHCRYFQASSGSAIDRSIYAKAMKDIAVVVKSTIAVWYNDIEAVYSKINNGMSINDMLNLNPAGDRINPSKYIKDVDFFETAFGILLNEISCAKKLAAVKYIYNFYSCGYYDKVDGTFDRMSSLDSNIDIVYIEEEKKILFLLDCIIDHTITSTEGDVNNKSDFLDDGISAEDKKFILSQVNPTYDGYYTEEQREIRDIALGRR